MLWLGLFNETRPISTDDDTLCWQGRPFLAFAIWIACMSLFSSAKATEGARTATTIAVLAIIFDESNTFDSAIFFFRDGLCEEGIARARFQMT